MKKTTTKNTAANNVNTHADAIMISDPEATATRAQRQLIGHAIKQEEYPRFTKEDWDALTKGRASEIISELRAGQEDFPASDAQKQKLSELIHRGHLKGLKRDTYKNLTSTQAKRMIYKGVENEKAGIIIEGFEPHEALPANAPMTERQKERLTQLVSDGYLNRFAINFFRSMTHEQASKFIGMGKARESEGVKAEPYVREEVAA